jgi:hypothetical protein
MKLNPPALLIASFALSLGAQQISIQGGGSIKIGEITHQFLPEALSAAPAKNRLPRAFLLQGKLIPQNAPKAHTLNFELTLFETGQIYRLEILKREGERERVRWGASLKTKIQILAFTPKLGGRLSLGMEGPLVGVVDAEGRESAWKGEIWATFSNFPE